MALVNSPYLGSLSGDHRRRTALTARASGECAKLNLAGKAGILARSAEYNRSFDFELTGKPLLVSAAFLPLGKLDMKFEYLSTSVIESP